MDGGTDNYAGAYVYNRYVPTGILAELVQIHSSLYTQERALPGSRCEGNVACLNVASPRFNGVSILIHQVVLLEWTTQDVLSYCSKALMKFIPKAIGVGRCNRELPL